MTWPAERRFFGIASLVILGSVFLGFVRFYYLRDPALPPLTPLFQVHGLVMTIWVVMFGTQAALIAKSPLGAASFLAVPSADLFLFGVLVAAAFWFRKQPAAHKRLMLLATVAMSTPAFARLPFDWTQAPVVFFGLADSIIIAAIVFDLVSRKRVHPALAYGGSLVVISQPVRFLLADTEAWRRLSAFVVG